MPNAKTLRIRTALAAARRHLSPDHLDTIAAELAAGDERRCSAVTAHARHVIRAANPRAWDFYGFTPRERDADREQARLEHNLIAAIEGAA